jgi:transposase
VNRGDNCQANSALHKIMVTRMAHHDRTRDYIAKRARDGKTLGEISRMLKRYIAREVYHHLPATMT